MKRSVSNFVIAVRQTYGWKNPIAKTKADEASLLLWLVAAAMFCVRLTWFSQLHKLIYRTWKGGRSEIPPLLAEIYLVSALGLELLVCLESPRVSWRLVGLSHSAYTV